MNRKLLTGLTLASVAGTGGAAYASVGGSSERTSSTSPAIPTVTAETIAVPNTTAPAIAVAAGTARTISYQVGDAGLVTVDVDGVVMTSRRIIPAEGWTIVAMTNSGTHVEVRFANAERTVGFTADLVGADVVVSVTNDRLPGVTDIALADPLPVSVIDDSDSSAPTVPTAPMTVPVVPATPPTPLTEPMPTAPPASSTTAPSSAGTGGHGDDDGEHESEDHDSEYEDGGDDD